MRVFDILDEFRALEAILNEVDPVSGEFVNNEDDIKGYITKLNIDKATKLNNIEDLKQELNGQIETLKTKIDKLSSRKKSIESNIDRLKDLQLLLLDGEKLKTDEYNFYFTTSKSLKVPDVVDETLEDLIKIEKIYDKDVIKDRLENANDDIKSSLNEKGFYIETKKSLVVR